MTDNLSELTSALRAISGRPIVFYPAYAELAGSINAGIFLSQMLYWTPRGREADGWVYKTQEEWTAETLLTRREQETARTKLKEIGVLRESRRGLPARLYYQADFQMLGKLLADLTSLDARERLACMAESATLARLNPPHIPYTEITTEITTRERGARPARAPSVSDEFVAKMIEKYGERLGGVEAVNETIAAALNHKASLGWLNVERGVDGWLRRDADRRAERQNGTMGPSPSRARKPMTSADVANADWSVEEGYTRAFDAAHPE